MNSLAKKYGSRDIGSIFIYANEAHPGDSFPHLTSMDEKFNHAKALRDQLPVERTILVDALDGACHRTYGGRPNMAWIFSRVGTTVYKADWTDPISVENALDYLLDVHERRRVEGELLAPMHVERLDFRIADHTAVMAALEKNGPKAVRDFKAAGY